MTDELGLIIVGRSSSHFTRVTRIFAMEAGLTYSFSVVPNLLSTNPADYGGNPALRVPSLLTPQGAWFGALNVCRELVRRSKSQLRPVWPEDLAQPLLANAQELTLQAMSTEVSLIMSKLAGGDRSGPGESKARLSLQGTLTWLEKNAKPLLRRAYPGPAILRCDAILFALTPGVSADRFDRALPSTDGILRALRVEAVRPGYRLSVRLCHWIARPVRCGAGTVMR